MGFLKRRFPWTAHVNAHTLRADLQAGVSNAVIVLPQGVAYAIIAGLPPEYGLYAAIVPAIVAALFGSSHHLISGPTAALSIVVFSVASQHAEPGSSVYIQTVLALTFTVGVFQLALALGKVGTLVNFVSHTVVVGFTTGIAILIMAGQIRYAFGIDIPARASFPQTIGVLLTSMGDISPKAMLVAGVTLAVGVLFHRRFPRSPYMLIGLAGGSVLALALDWGGEELAMVGEIPSTLPPFHVPQVGFQTAATIFPGAIAIGVLGLVEAVSIGRTIALRSGQLINGNREFFGQGMSNIVGSLCSCYVSSGSFSRSGANYDSGAATPLSGVFAGVSLAVIVVLFSSLTKYLPLAAVAAIIFLVGWRLLMWRHIWVIIRSSPEETFVLGLTFFSVLLSPLEMAVYIGIAASLALHLRRTSRPRVTRVEATDRPEDVAVIRVEGDLFFGAVNSVAEQCRLVKEPYLILTANGVSSIDIAGVKMLADEAERRQAAGGNLFICKLGQTANDMLVKDAFIDTFRDLITPNIRGAMKIIKREQDDRSKADGDFSAAPTDRAKSEQ